MFAACQKDRLPFVNDWMFFMISFQHSSCFRFVWWMALSIPWIKYCLLVIPTAKDGLTGSYPLLVHCCTGITQDIPKMYMIYQSENYWPDPQKSPVPDVDMYSWTFILLYSFGISVEYLRWPSGLCHSGLAKKGNWKIFIFIFLPTWQMDPLWNIQYFFNSYSCVYTLSIWRG